MIVGAEGGSVSVISQQYRASGQSRCLTGGRAGCASQFNSCGYGEGGVQAVIAAGEIDDSSRLACLVQQRLDSGREIFFSVDAALIQIQLGGRLLVGGLVIDGDLVSDCRSFGGYLAGTADLARQLYVYGFDNAAGVVLNAELTTLNAAVRHGHTPTGVDGVYLQTNIAVCYDGIVNRACKFDAMSLYDLNAVFTPIHVETRKLGPVQIA